MRALIYCRLSKDRNGLSESVARQERDCRELCAREGWVVAGVFSDNDMSGFKRGLRRPGFDALQDAIRAGACDAVVVWKIDRLTRQPRQLEPVIDMLEDARVLLRSVNDPVDASTPTGRMVLRMAGAMASAESENTSLRMRAANRSRAENGEPSAGGLRPFGHTVNRRAVVEHEAVLVREAAGRLVHGESLNSVCRDWADRGVVTSRGKLFRPTTLRQMLVSPRLAGMRVYRGREIPSPVIPAILEEDVWRRLVAVLASPPAASTGGRSALGGLLVCGVCGSVLKWKGRGGSDRPVYRCTRVPGTSACGGVVVSAGPLEQLIGDLLVDALDLEALGNALLPAHVAPVVAELEVVRGRWAQLDVDYAAGLTSRDGYVRAVAVLQAEVTRLEGVLHRSRAGELVAGLDAGERVADAWRRRGAAWRNALARTLIERVVVNPARSRGSNRFDPGRVRVVWREEGRDPGE